MAASAPIRSYGMFKGWNWTRVDALRVRVWNTCICDVCVALKENPSDQVDELVGQSLIIY